MEYIKKVLMLRRTDSVKENQKPLSVLARIEIEGGVGEFYISVVNLPSSMKNVNYYATIVDNKGVVYEFDLGGRPTSFSKTFHKIPSIESGVAIGLYCTSEQIPIVLAFASQGNGISLEDFKKIVADKCFLRFKENLKKENKDCQLENVKNERALEERKELCQEILVQYNDEAVATENYYELDEEIRQKLMCIKENDSENIFFEDEYVNCSNKKTEKEKCLIADGAQNEKNTCECQKSEYLEQLKTEKESCINPNYYESVKEELDKIFYSHQSEERLEKIFKGSRWAKIFYSKDKFYVVGLIFEKSKEKYICYGVPSRYKKTPPKALEGYASFIPLSVFDMFGDGYFIMFQDAMSGRCVHFN